MDPARPHTVGIPTAVPAVSGVAEPNVAIIRFAHDVAIAIVSGSVFVRVPSSVVMVAATVMTAEIGRAHV